MNSDRHEFRTLASADIYRGAIMALRADQVAMPGGVSAKREVVEHFGAVAIAPLDDEGRLVMIHQYRHPLGDWLWELPAGLLDIAGEPPLTSAKRELAEEAGLAAADWSVLAEVAASPGITDEVVRVYLARELSTVDRQLAEHDEEADIVVRRIPVADALRMVFAGEIINGASVAGVLATHAVLTGAARPRDTDAPWPSMPTTFADRVAKR